jgi:hypothetical protein
MGLMCKSYAVATYIKTGDTQKETCARVQSVTECVMTYLSESVGEQDELYYPFEEAFREQVSPSLVEHLKKRWTSETP